MSKEPQWNTVHPWMKAAYDFAVKNNSFCMVKYETAEYLRWQAYFADLGWTPYAFRRLGEGCTEWTAPCQWAEWLPAELTDLKPLPAPPRPIYVEKSRANRMSLSELRAKHGPNWGIGERKAIAEQIGQEAFDAIPDAKDTWVEAEWPMGR